MSSLPDGFWMLVVRRGKAYAPTMARTEAGFYLASEPVFVADTSASWDVEVALLNAVRNGNPLIPTPDRDSVREYVVLKYSGTKSLSAFERLATKWRMSCTNGKLSIAPYRTGRYGGFEEDPDREEFLPDSASLEEGVRRLVERALEL